MKRCIIACSMIKRDILPLIESIEYKADVIWMDEKLHNFPKELNKALQEEINKHQDCDEIILVFLLCGNALLGITSPHAGLRYIKGDDCIYASLCHREDYMDLRRTSFFVSHGWLNTDGYILAEYKRNVEKYGEARAQRIWHAMYKNYQYLVYMDNDENGNGPDEKEQDYMNQIAALAQVEQKVLKGSLELYKKLLYLENDCRIAQIEAGKIISAEDCKPA